MENESVFILDIDGILVKVKKHSYKYTFLNLLSDKINIINIYDLIESFDEFKLKNLYYFIYLKLIFINKSYPEINLIKKNEKYLNCEDFDQIMDMYIKKEFDCIIMINLILLFFFPNKMLFNI
jgi:hypothetical protein